MYALGVLLEDDLELAEGLKGDDVVLTGDAVEKVSAPGFERPVEPCTMDAVVSGLETVDSAEVGDVLDVLGEIGGVFDDEVLDRRLRCETLRFRQVGPETHKGGGGGTDEGPDVAELEGAEEGTEGFESDEAKTRKFERRL